MRKIIHIDMDAFYASIEQRDNPQYRGLPVAVGHAGPRGVVAAASYEARQYGVHSAMASVTALRKCPHLTFLPARFDLYKEISAQIQAIFHEYTDLVEPLSLDEAFLDVTINKKGIPSATLIAREIKEKIKMATGLTASAGVSINKFLAKIASDYRKPDGLFTIEPEQAEAFVEQLSIEYFFGIGKVTAEKMHRLGIFTGADLKRFTRHELVHHFGKTGNYYYLSARAIDDRPVTPDRLRKSVGAENTFEVDTDSHDFLLDELEYLREKVLERVRKSGFTGRTATIKIKFDDFQQITRSRTIDSEITDPGTLKTISEELLVQVDLTHRRVRLLGLSVSNHSVEREEPIQLKFDFDRDQGENPPGI